MTPTISRYLSTAAFLALAVSCFAQTSYTISTVAGNGTRPAFSGDGGPATGAQLGNPIGVAVDASHNLYIADQTNNRVREVNSQGTISTLAGSGTAGFTGDGKAATSADLNNPLGVAVKSDGTVFIADTTNDVVRQVTSGGTISTPAGNYGAGIGYGGDGGDPTLAVFNGPSSLALDSAGNLYISDTANHRVREVIWSQNVIVTVAGNGNPGYSGDSGLAKFARLHTPLGIAVDAAGNLYIADSGNQVIRKVDPSGVITTIAGNGTPGFSGDNGPATQASLNYPSGVAVDAAGNLYIADRNNFRIRMVSNGIITTIAGSGAPGFGGDGGYALNAALKFPSGVAVDAAGNVYVADTQNDAIRLLTPIANPPAVAPKGVITAGNFGASPIAAPGSWIEIYGSNLAKDARPWNSGDFTGLTAPTSLDGTSVTIGGVPAFLSYVSPGQIDAQVPGGVGPGSLPLAVTTANGSSTAYNVTVDLTAPGLYAPPSLNIGGKQYAGALFTDGKTYAAPAGAASGIASRPAHPGDTITLYGVGFGPVTANTPPGQISQGQSSLSKSLTVSFGQTPATVTYQGLAPDAVGLYQFNVTVPQVPSGDAVPLKFTLDGVPGTQTLYVAIQD
ncbi:MAG TPA: IPT/TIG domain-containing protein [Bryobacteraceae bacterium]|nr:IPT/TIG domain-containing protein [Bryobacteraceae bacterium]